MKVSLKTAQRYSNVELLKDGVDALVSAIGQQLGAVEDVIDWGARYDGIVVARVVECEPHPDADSLSVCLVDDAGAVKDVERDENGYVQVVCGANNVASGQSIAWIPPGTVVPETAGREPFELSSKELRGVMSHGMIASKRELMIADEHEGILVINESDVEDVKLLEPGTPFLKLYGLDDTVIDLENKMFTHRPDCFGTLGVARELAAIQGETFKSPDWYQHEPTLPDENNSLKASIEKNDASRFMLVDIKDVKVADSPVWLQSALMKIGIKPLNNIVDITNYVMHVSGQPLHAYDYEKVAKNGAVDMSVRKAEKGETVALINDSTVELDEDDVVIATADAVVGIAGVMGGRESEVSDETTRIVLECGTFDMYAIRRSAMRHGLFTEAVTRFNKGQSPLQNPYVVGYALQLINELSGGTAEASVDVKQAAMEQAAVVVSSDFINKRLGSELSAQEITDVLARAEIVSSIDGESIRVQPPFWRMDLAIAEDIVEEVGRLVGFHDLPAELPRRPTKAAAKNRHLAFETELRHKLAAAGANEVLTYNFVHGSLNDAAGQSQEQGYRLRNALSPELQFYRQSLTPNLAEQVYPNIRAGNDQIVMFEIGSSHHRAAMDSSEAELPQEIRSLGLIVSASDTLKREETAGAAFYAARSYLDYLLDAIGVEFQIESLEADDDSPHVKPYDTRRMARIVVNGEAIGVIGEINPALSDKLKLPNYTAAFEVMIEPLLGFQATQQQAHGYEIISKYPSTDRDVTVRLSDTYSYGELYSVLLEFAENTSSLRVLKPIGSYRSEKDDTARNITHTLVFRSDEKTLQTDEVNDIVDSLSELLANRFDATIV